MTNYITITVFWAFIWAMANVQELVSVVLIMMFSVGDRYDLKRNKDHMFIAAIPIGVLWIVCLGSIFLSSLN